MTALQQQWGVPGLSPIFHLLAYCAKNDFKNLTHAIKGVRMIKVDELQTQAKYRFTQTESRCYSTRVTLSLIVNSSCNTEITSGRSLQS